MQIKARQSERQKALGMGWQHTNVTEEWIREECDRHLDGPIIEELIPVDKKDPAEITALCNKSFIQEALIVELRNQIQDRDNQIQDRDNQIQDRDNQIQHRDSQIQDRDSQIQDRDSQIQAQALEASLDEKNGQISELHGELASIKQSLIWRATMNFQALVDHLLPWGTRRRGLFELELTVIRIVVNEGLRSFFWRKFRDYRKRGCASRIKPTQIRLEASSVCQLMCPSCPTANKAIPSAVGSGFLKLRDFQKLLHDNPRVTEVELSNFGEIFLNPALLEIIKCAHGQSVAFTANNGVNLNNVKEDVLEGLVKYRFRSMTCSIDGTSDETYRTYRVGGNFETVIENIRKINLYKKRYESECPQLMWQFVVFGHNEHEIPLARELASDLGMGFYLKLSWDSEFSPVRNHEYVRKEVGAATRDEYKRKYGLDYIASVCHQLWDQPQINWDGKVLGCCRSWRGDFGGNAFKDGLLSSLNNEQIRYARDMLLGKKVARADIPCSTCGIYSGMRADGKWLRREPPFLPLTCSPEIWDMIRRC